MIGWNPSYNWTYGEFRQAVDHAFNVDREEVVSLDVEHSDRKNMDDIAMWAEELGYKAVEAHGGDIIRIMKG